MHTTAIVVTPDMAIDWLQKNPLNRNLRRRVVAKYAADMRSGHWGFTHQGIAFYEDGTLADGQHRLAAIVSSGASVQMLATFGLPQSAASAVDQSAPRLAHDAIRIGGGFDWIDKNAVSVARVLISNFNSTDTTPTVNEIEAYLVKHDVPIRKALSVKGKNRKFTTPAGIIACYAAAIYCGLDQEKIDRFAQIMQTGEIAGTIENSAIRLREYLMTTPAAWTGGAAAVDSAKRAQRAIQAFCAGQYLSKLYAPKDLIYLID